MNFRGRQKPDPIAFQIAPLIDFLLVLLCYCLATQLFFQWEAEIDIALPTAQTAQLDQRLPGEIILNIFQNGDVVVNGRKLGEGDLTALLQRLVKLFPGQPVLIRSDRKTAYEHVIRVLDMCRQSDIWNIAFATGTPEAAAAK
jgi:biopolymer transport protein ExbD